jgi:hypothetical protein
LPHQHFHAVSVPLVSVPLVSVCCIYLKACYCRTNTFPGLGRNLANAHDPLTRDGCGCKVQCFGVF